MGFLEQLQGVLERAGAVEKKRFPNICPSAGY